MAAAETHILSYVPARQTIAAAAGAGASVGDYLEMGWGESGKRQHIADDLLALTGREIKRVCEIGTGAGLVAEKVLAACSPALYESYEPDSEWAEWLQTTLGIVSRPSDGVSLNHTASSSMDLILANGVFVYLPFLTTYGYLEEMGRVAGEKGYIAFDMFSENCLDDETVRRWLATDDRYACFLSAAYVIEFFAKRGIRLVGRFFSAYGVGRSEYFVFKK